MKSLKRGNNPSLMSGVRGIVVAMFGIFWTIGAIKGGLSMGYWLGGMIFVCVSIGYAIYNFTMARGKSRYTEYHLVDESAEAMANNATADENHCSDCGAQKDATDNYCRNCGKRF